MKRTTTLAILLLITTNCILAQTKSILFLGNSYTAVNNLPQTIKDLSLSLGDSIVFDSNTPGGYTFQGHSTNATSLAKINQQAWDYVVLQEQSQLPSFSPNQVASAVYPFARTLDSLILTNDSCTETIFYMTWGRQNGDASNCASYPPICTYDGMQQRLRDSYMEMGLNNHATISPVGVAWKNMRDNYPAINLYQADQSHPSIYGTYLAACVFYSTIFHKSSVGAGFVTSGISNTDALIIQTIASNTVLDSLSTWQDMGDIPSAAYTYTVNNNTVNFTNTSLNSTNFTWDFGDGNSSSTANPQHTYTNPGTYTISLTASTICNEFTTTDTITIIPTIIINLDNTDFNIYPNPTSGVVTLQFSSLQDEITIQLFNSIGQKLVHQNCSSVNTVTLDLTTYNLGIYQIVVIDKKGTISCTPLIKK
jgi:hypothetical protein